MGKTDHDSTVRIEFDGGADADGGPDIGEVAPQPGRRGRFAALATGAIVAALLVLSSLPEEGRTAAGTARAVPTTTEAAPTTTAAVPPASQLGATARPVDRVVLRGGQSIREIVRADVGYIAIGEPRTGIAPPLFRSVDGRTWTEMETSYEGPELSISLGAQIAQHSGLARVGEGYVISLSQLPRPDGRNGWARLRSDDALTWTLDPAFETLELEALVFGLGNSADRSDMLVFEPGGFRDLVLTGSVNAVLDGSVEPIDCVSWVEVQRPAVAQPDEGPIGEVFTCDGRTVELRVEDLADPGAWPDQYPCLIDLRTSGGRISNLAVGLLEAGDTAPVVIDDVPFTGYIPSVRRNGEIVTVNAPQFPAGLADTCVSLIPPLLRDTATRRLEVRSVDGSMRSHDIPAEVELARSDFLPIDVVESGSVLFLPAANGVWSLDVSTGVWMLAQPVPEGVELVSSRFGRASVLIDSGAGYAFVFEAGRLHWAPIGGEWHAVPFARSETRGAAGGTVLLADDDVAFLGTLDGTFRIDLVVDDS